MKTFLKKTYRPRGQTVLETSLPEGTTTPFMNIGDREFKFEFGEVLCTVYYRYRYFEFEGRWYFGHTDIIASDLDVAVKTVMAQEKESMRGHTGDRGTVEFVYATNNLDPNRDLWVWVNSPAATVDPVLIPHKRYVVYYRRDGHLRHEESCGVDQDDAVFEVQHSDQHSDGPAIEVLGVEEVE